MFLTADQRHFATHTSNGNGAKVIWRVDEHLEGNCNVVAQL